MSFAIPAMMGVIRDIFASGSGEHVVHLREFPKSRFSKRSDPGPEARAKCRRLSGTLRTGHEPAHADCPGCFPMALAIASADGISASTMVQISPWDANSRKLIAARLPTVSSGVAALSLWPLYSKGSQTRPEQPRGGAAVLLSGLSMGAIYGPF